MIINNNKRISNDKNNNLIDKSKISISFEEEFLSNKNLLGIKEFRKIIKNERRII